MTYFVQKLLLFMIVGLGISCIALNPVHKIETDSNTITEDEYAVFLAVLKNGSEYPIIIDGKARAGKGPLNYESLHNHFKGLKSDAIRNLELQNAKPYSTEIKVRSRKGFPLVAQERWLDREYEYDNFYLFSRVGFSEDGKQAIVFLETRCQPLCAGSTVHFLTHENKTWTLQKDWIFWIS